MAKTKKAVKKTVRKRNALFSGGGLFASKPRITAETWNRAGDKRKAQAARLAGWPAKRAAELSGWDWHDVAALDPEWQSKLMRGLARTYAKNPAKRKAAKKSAKRKSAKVAKKNTARMTRALAIAAAKDAALRQMKKAGRSAWSVADRAVYEKTFDRLWPAEYDVVGGPHYRNPRKTRTAAKKPAELRMVRLSRERMNRLDDIAARRLKKEGWSAAEIAEWRKVNPKRKPAKRRNSSAVAGAKRLVKRFIGKATGRETKATHPGLKKGTVLAKLVRLDYLKVRNPSIAGGMIAWKKNERPVVASKASGRKYFFVGGNQNLNVVPPVRAANPGGLADLGEVMQLGYTARKHVDNYRLQAYYHKLGEENGKRPHLMYDRKKKQMYFKGGDYRTEAEGIAN